MGDSRFRWLGPEKGVVHLAAVAPVNAVWDLLAKRAGARLQAEGHAARATIRRVLGPDRLLLDANQVGDVDATIEWTRALAACEPWWIEEPTSPDDVLGHARIRDAVAPVRAASGEHCHNRVMFKQFLMAGALDAVQLDACRLGVVNEHFVDPIRIEEGRYRAPSAPAASTAMKAESLIHFAFPHGAAWRRP